MNLISEFLKQVKESSDTTAISTSEKQISYRELNWCSDCIAAEILKYKYTQGHIALLFEQGPDMIIGAISVLKAGLTYIPLSHQYPVNRLKYILKDSQTELLITNSKNIEIARSLINKLDRKLNIVNLDNIEFNSNGISKPSTTYNNKNAYILYTSGSTGKPKGVIQNQKNILHFSEQYAKGLNIGKGTKMTLFSYFCHDAAVIDIFSGILHGATLYPKDIREENSFYELKNWLVKEKINIWHSVPTLYRHFTNELSLLNKDIDFIDLKYIVLGGENVVKQDINDFKKFFQKSVLINLYGQSESSYNSAQFIYPKDEDKMINIGDSIDDTDIFVVDEFDEEVLPLRVGEIVISSPYIALGYWNKEELSKQVFSHDTEFGNLYWTGDIGRLEVDGSITWLGRKDHQVKIRGYRIELGEIESCLMEHEKINDVVAIIKEIAKGDTKLVVYYTATEFISEMDIREFTNTRLASYMIPNIFIKIDEIPLTASGKVDRNELSKLDVKLIRQKKYEGVSNEIEAMLLEIWENILGVKGIGVHDNFFELGGHSLKATILSGRIYKELDIEVKVKDIFECPSIRTLADRIKESSVKKYERLVPLQKQDSYPISSAQRRIYAIQMMNKDNTAYNMTLTLELFGKVDIDKIKEVIEKLVAKHEALRTSFHLEGEDIVQRIEETVKVNLNYAKVEKEEEINNIIKKWTKPFALNKAPLLRGGIVEAKDSYILMLDMHHIISDGTTMGILAEDFVKVYEGSNLNFEPIQYKEYSMWEKKQKENGVWEQQKSYWKNEFQGEIPILELPLDSKRNNFEDNIGSYFNFEIQEDIVKGLKERMLGVGGTLYMGLLAGYYILMSKYSGSEDIVIGTPIAGRKHPQMEKIAGIFINTLAIRSYPESKKTIEDYLKETKQKLLKAYENQEYPYEELVEEMDIKRDLSRNPLFDVMLVLQNTEVKEMKLSDIEIKPYQIDNNRVKFDITLSILEVKDKLVCKLEYKSNLYTKETIEQMMKHYVGILDTLVKEKYKTIGEINLLSVEEENQLLDNPMEIQVDYNLNTIAEIFEKQVKNTPNNIAAQYGEEKLTYNQLNTRANQLARVLRDKGINRDSIVGIMVEPSLEMVVGILAILKSGGAYLPIDPYQPEDRIAYIIKDSKTQIVVTTEDLTHKISIAVQTIYIDNRGLIEVCGSNLEKLNKARDLAYIIYTSGSTGKPKGVMIEHRNVISLMANNEYLFNFNNNDIWCMFHSYAFDFSVWEMFGALLHGGKLIVIPKYIAKDTKKFLELIEKEEITVLNQTPSACYNLINEEIKGAKRELKLRYIIFGGEALNPSKLRVWKERYPDVELINMYGITETTVHVTFKKLEESDFESTLSNIGKAIPTLNTYIMDKNLKLLPIGVPGEICVSGGGVARGYLNRYELTEQKFVTNPYKCEERLYRSGDLGRLLKNGEIEYLGRIDNQVKIRGYRIELGEIENPLLKHSEIKEVVVITREDYDKDKYLCAYIVSDNEAIGTQLREYLKKHIPDYMIPAYFVCLEKMPLTVNGKIDRRALPEPDRSIIRVKEYEGARNEVDKILVDIWKEVLSIKGELGINDNFFEIGGDSIKAIQIAARLQKYSLGLEIQSIFEHPTIKQLSYYVRDIKKTGEQGEITGNVDLTPIQRWLFGKNMTAEHHFNQSVVLYREEGFKEEIVEKAFKEIVKHHDALRMVYEEIEGKIIQINRGIEEKLVDIELYDITDKKYEEIIEERSQAIQCSMNLNSGPLVKLGLFKTIKGDYLLIAIHHLVVDGVSWRIIFEDFTTVYKQIEEGRRVELPLKTTSFKEWAAKLNEYSKSEELSKEVGYWSKLEMQDIYPIPKDNIVKENKLKDSNSISIELSKGETLNLLGRVNRAYNTEINDILLSALGLTIKEWSQNDKILINLEGHGREEILEDMYITRTVGWFTSLYPVVLNIEGYEEISKVIKNTKENLRNIPNKGIGYGILKYMAPKEYTEKMRLNLTPEICFNYLGQFDGDVNNELFKMGEISGGNSISINSERDYTLNIVGIIAKDTLRISVDYNKNEYKNESILSFTEKYKKNLKKIIDHCINKEEIEMTLSDFTSSDLNENIIETIFSKTQEMAVRDIYSLSPMQEGMLFHHIMDKKASAYFEQTTIGINGDLDWSIVEKSFNKLIEKYDVLRTIFVHKEIEKPRQVVLRKRESRINFKDISGLEEEKKIIFIEDFKEKDREKGFDLEKDIPMRISIMKCNKESYKLIWSFHHIIMDGWCLAIIMKDFLDYYVKLKNDKNIKFKTITPYSTYIKWLEKKDTFSGIEYWKEYLKGYDNEVSIPKLKNTKGNTYKPNEHKVVISRELTEKLKTIGNKNNVTINTILEVVWGILLSKYNNTQDVVFGAVVSGRSAEIPDVEAMVGLFINTIPVRIEYEINDIFSNVIKKVQQIEIKSREYDYIPLAEIQSNSKLKHNLINHVIAFENYPVEDKLESLDNKKELGFSIKDVKTLEHTNYDFEIVVTPREELNIAFRYNSMIYSKENINRVGLHLLNILQKIIEDEEIRISDIKILTQEEEKEIIYDFKDNIVNYANNKTIVDLFEKQVRNTPNNIAAEYGEEKLTYNQLNTRANQLARVLRDKGINRDRIVGIMVEPSLEMVVGILAILKSGGAYLPIDPYQPEDRIAYIIKDSKTQIVVTTEDLTHKISIAVQTIYIDNRGLIEVCGSNLEKLNKARDLAYIIYTSGSTGKPKGVMIDHRNVISLMANNEYLFNFNNNDIWCMFHSYAFDFSVWEMFGALLHGGKLIVIPKYIAKDTKKFLELIEKEEITVLNQTPSACYNLINEEIKGVKRELKLRYIIFGGEALNPSKLRVWKERYPDVELINMYGITETTVHVTFKKLEESDFESTLSNIGKAIPTLNTYIMDKNLKLLPIGVPGEICVSGGGVARGYLNRYELTEQKFVINPYKCEERLYRSGDLGRLLENGEIEYLGRIDNQVKIRGYRIELGEIENIIRKQSGVREILVLAKEDEYGDKYLCGYIVKEEKTTIEAIREGAKKELPEYMVPGVMVEIDKFPLTNNGKIDIKVLFDMEVTISRDKEYRSPRNEIEEKLVMIWEEILNTHKIGINDDFFELGGHSLKATTLSGRIQKELNVEVTVRDIFECSNIRDLSKRIKTSTAKEYEKLIPLETKESYPVSSAQRRIYAIQMMDKESTVYNMPLTLELTGKVDRGRIEKAIEKLISKHEALRTSFHLEGEKIVQKINEEVKVELDYARAEEKEEIDQIIERWIKAFNLEKAPLLRAGIIEVKGSHVLMLDMHHIISDGTTMGILAEDFGRAYEGVLIDAQAVQYKEYAVWENQQKEKGIWDKQKEYWKKEYEGEIPVLNLPLDGKRSSIEDNLGSKIRFEIEKEIVTELKERLASIGGTLYMGLMAGFSILMSKYSGSEDVVIGTTIAGRRHPQMERVAGMFVNTLAIRNYPVGKKTIEEYLKETKQKLLGAYENQEYPYEELVNEVLVKRDLSRNPLFDVLLDLQNTELKEIKLSDIQANPYGLKRKKSKFDMSLTAKEAGNKLICQIEYKDKLFNKETIEGMIKGYIKILKEIAENREGLIKDIELLENTEKRKLIFDFNETIRDYPSEKMIQEFFEDQVGREPENIAVVFEDKKLTYREVNKKSNSLARVLRDKGVKQDSIVAIMIERSIELVVGIMAILKAGGAYLPIDPLHPQDRIKYMLKDSQANILLTQEKLVDRIKFNGEIINLEDKDLYDNDSRNLIYINKSTDLAYIIYTSGSTGKPKGVSVEHRALSNFLYTMYHRYNEHVGLEDNCLSLTNISFDVSVAEIFLPLVFGGKLVLFNNDRLIDIIKLSDLIIKEKITFAYIPPTILLDVCNLLKETKHSVKLNKMLVGVEPIKDYVLEEFLELNREMKILNGYGPTEATICATMYDYKSKEITGENVPIGKPLNNTQVYLLNKYNNPVPIGVSGELCISGYGVARGYLNRAKLTAEKFIENPFIKGSKMYKTGDMARWLPDGNIHFIGRIDNQVKIRGYRIELGEIEAALLSYEDIKEAVVISKNGYDEYNDKYLCGYIVSDKEINISELREYIGKKLPKYMLPSYFMQLEKIPITPNGKVNSKALPEPERGIDNGVEYKAPKDRIEEILVNVWERVLSTKGKIGVNDSFFDIGGDSIKAIQIAARLQKYNLKLEVQSIFEYPTIRQLSYYVKEIKKNIDQGTITGEVNLTPIQAWFFEQNTEDIHHWNQSIMLFREWGFRTELIEEAFKKIVKHHDALRMIYEVNKEAVTQINRGLRDDLIDLKIYTIDEEEYEKVIEEKAKNIQSSINLSKGPLVKLGVFRTTKGDYLLIAIHHLVIDGISWRIILEDFNTVYKQLESGVAVEFPLKTTSFKEWSQRLSDYSYSEELLKEMQYWNSIESENILPLRKDNKANENKLKDSKSVSIALSKEETENLLGQVNKAYNTEINDILLTALGLTIKEWSGMNKVLINLEGHGREEIIQDVDLTRTVGWFTTQYPLVLDMKEAKELASVVKNTKETLRRIPKKGIGYSVLKYITPKEYTEEIRFNLSPEISFNYLGQFDTDMDNDLFAVKNIAMGNSMSMESKKHYTLDIVGVIIKKTLNISVNYNKYEYRSESIIEFIESYKLKLQSIINHCLNRKETEMTLSDYTSSNLDELEMEDIFNYVEDINID